MADKCTSWAIVATMERPDGTWYTDTITEIDGDTASSVDSFLTEYCEDEERIKIVNKEIGND
tara:strand:+ start:248 stop:433 length:186 start_codon:yes stop_codon:yes gene_type:complete